MYIQATADITYNLYLEMDEKPILYPYTDLLPPHH